MKELLGELRCDCVLDLHYYALRSHRPGDHGSIVTYDRKIYEYYER
ncbi:MAG: hypothetical protein IKJ43_04960 [Bacilli bacterium]|nr:hypothetical protein [Bacilli bacterium]